MRERERERGGEREYIQTNLAKEMKFLKVFDGSITEPTPRTSTWLAS